MLIAIALAGAAPAAPPAPAAAAASCGRDALSRDINACDSALAAEKSAEEKANLLYERAYAWNERDRPEKALEDLDAALKLDPRFADALHERAYTLGELARFDAALRDLDRELEIRPAAARVYRERTYARLAAADFAGAYADAVRASELEPENADAHLLRAERALWLGRFDEASREVDRAEALASAQKSTDSAKPAADVRAVVAAWRTTSGAASPAQRCTKAFDTATVAEPNVIGDCTAAFFAARDAGKKAEFLTYRSVAWAAGQQDEGRLLIDAEVAAALDPANPDMLVNVAGVYNRRQRYHAALGQSDRALAIKASGPGFAARAAARYGLGDARGAFEDAKRSFEIKPNEIALTVLGDLARDSGDKASAKRYWMGAYHLGDRDDDLTARLKSIGIDHPDQEPPAR